MTHFPALLRLWGRHSARKTRLAGVLGWRPRSAGGSVGVVGHRLTLAAARLRRLVVGGVLRGDRSSVGLRTLHEVVVDDLAATHGRCRHVPVDVLVRRVLERRCPSRRDVRPHHGVLHLGVEGGRATAVPRQGLVDVVPGCSGVASPAVGAVAGGVGRARRGWPGGDGRPRCRCCDGDGSSDWMRYGCAWCRSRCRLRGGRRRRA